MASDSPHRLEELILYIAERMARDQHAGRGRIKLAKLLFMADFQAYARFGKSITGANYHADELGPAPTDEMLATRDLESRGHFAFEPGWDRQQLPIAKRSADTDLFTARELELVDELLARYQHRTAGELVEEAHRFPGWQHAWRNGAGKNSPVPYESIFWHDRRQLKPWEQEHADRLADEFALGRAE